MTPVLDIVIDERTTPSVMERIRRNLVTAVREIQRMSFVRTIKEDLTLADGVPTAIYHGFGRRAHVWHSPPRNATTTGRIVEVRDGSHDPTKYVVLTATGWGASITVDVFGV